MVRLTLLVLIFSVGLAAQLSPLDAPVAPESPAIAPPSNALDKSDLEFYVRHLYVYGPVSNIPPGVELRDAEKILPAASVFTYSHEGAGRGSYAGFSNWFRYELLYRNGNIWIDLDVVCLQPFDFPDPLVFGWEQRGKVGSAVLKFPAGDRACRFMSDTCRMPMTWPGKSM